MSWSCGHVLIVKKVVGCRCIRHLAIVKNQINYRTEIINYFPSWEGLGVGSLLPTPSFGGDVY
ncbi:MAG: hypothetical protein SWX82_11860 [Cyanobacteriota bacterium]|nr:hypothetical protein [Cyanobacteriota bacterium]